MADEFLHNYKQSSDMEFINQFSCLNPIHHDISALNLNSFYNILPNLEPFPPLFIEEDSTVLTQPILSSNIDDHRDRKRKAIQVSMSQTTSANSSTQLSANGSRKPKNRKKGKGNIKEEGGEPREVIHVRAKRGEATDSHSLAERVRRGKINERLRCLQDIVPGCYKTMGMSVMLDEIINYVHSLQNQVEFLSMKLTAASTFHDFNSGIDAIETMQRAEEFGALKIQNVGRQEELLSTQLFASQPPYNR